MMVKISEQEFNTLFSSALNNVLIYVNTLETTYKTKKNSYFKWYVDISTFSGIKTRNIFLEAADDPEKNQVAILLLSNICDPQIWSSLDLINQNEFEDLFGTIIENIFVDLNDLKNQKNSPDSQLSQNISDLVFKFMERKSPSCLQEEFDFLKKRAPAIGYESKGIEAQILALNEAKDLGILVSNTLK